MAADRVVAYKIDESTLARRLHSLYSHWRKHRDDLWESCNAFAVATPPPSDDDIRYLKSSALHLWLFGFEFPETIMVFSDTQIHFLCSQKKASLLDVVKKCAKDAVGVDVVLHVKAKNDDGVTLMDSIFHAIQSHGNGNSIVFGLVAKETQAPEGKLVGKWVEKLKSSRLKLNDLTNGLAHLFVVKEANELTNVKKAAYLVASVMEKHVVQKLRDVIEKEKVVSHSSLMDATEKVILNPAKVDVKLIAANCDICYPPIFQSGGKFDLRPKASSNVDNLYYESASSVIICALGSRYNSYCANVARTILIESDATQTKSYQVLRKAHEAAIGAIKPGNKASDVYKAALSVVEKEAPELTTNLTKSAGTGIGLEFRELVLNLNEKNDRILRTGMVLNVALGFQNMQTKSSKTKSHNYALFLADTVIVTATGREVATSKSSKDHSYPFNDSKEKEDVKPKVKFEPKHTEAIFSKATRRSNNHEMSKEESRRQHQAELARKDPERHRELEQQIKTLKKDFVSRESERAERASLVTQEKLVLAGYKFKPLKLIDLWIRPPFPGRGRKLPGTLECHENGFRYSTSRSNERVDILFGNIKHAFFQPAEKELITLLHFHLHNHIMVGNKKTKDVQFYVEVMDVVQNLGGSRRCAYDPDEIEEEHRERARKNKISMGFQSFASRVNELWRQPKFRGLDLEFDQPLRELGFHGVPHKASTFIVPTASCLVELIETPFLVVTLSDIEIVNLERVGLGQKNFDMAIVFKDFKRDVLRIDSIPCTSLEGIKEWLDTAEIKYYESRLNMNWQEILKTIMDNPEDFITNKGWEFLNLEASDSESDSADESDQGYTPSDVEYGSESDDDEADSASFVESEDDDDEDEEMEESEEEVGKTWEELEREATNADREKGDESDSEDERKRRKMKAFGKSRAGPSTSAPKRPKFRSLNFYDSMAQEKEKVKRSGLDKHKHVNSEDDDDEDEEMEESEEEVGKTWEELEREATNADREKGDESDSEDERKRRKMKAFGKSRAGPSTSAPKRPKFRRFLYICREKSAHCLSLVGFV
ncbi:peptidase M24, structural domain-containing protein [Artemisia annua]|uniref:FACT complex subunit n=1 Tax=Artemisia annua TaxID=35608 RepID=A0A2U1QBN3_ARTAN|nr:peptidase M24, structural domain-containing protein [Artemisia annua]